MNTAIAFSGAPQRAPQPRAKASPVRLLPTPHVAQPLPRPASAQAQHEPTGKREPLLLGALALALHAGIVWGFWHHTEPAHTPRLSQEMELLRIPPAPKPEPPQQRKPEPPKAVATPQPNTPPPAALRTAPAEVPQPNTLSIPENLTATASSGPVVAAPPIATPAPKTEDPITEANGAAAYLNNPPPAYPKAAQRQGLQGRVVLRVQVLANGQVGALEVKLSSGKPLLDDAALAAVKAWVFTPSKRGTTPIDGWTQVPIEFRLAG